jgi:glycogen debranching enzyme
MGLRTLDTEHPAYHPHDEGGPAERDEAYHQGTVWPWLLGPYVTALIREKGERGRKRARQVLETALGHLTDAGMGTFSEIFDAEPPHAARGAIAQAWSVAELLRVWGDVANASGGAPREFPALLPRNKER